MKKIKKIMKVCLIIIAIIYGLETFIRCIIFRDYGIGGFFVPGIGFSVGYTHPKWSLDGQEIICLKARCISYTLSAFLGGISWGKLNSGRAIYEDFYLYSISVGDESKKVIKKINRDEVIKWRTQWLKEKSNLRRSSDGNKMAYIDIDGLWVKDVNEKWKKKICNLFPGWGMNNVRNSDIRWSPDGSKIMIINGELWIINTDGTNLRKIKGF
jgi:Tol biopolymer transport system component